MLVEIGVGDAYGLAFETLSAEQIGKDNDLTYHHHHKYKEIQPGRYSDDTQMSIAVAEAVLHDEFWTPISLADRFLAAFQRDPRQGYTGGFYSILRSVNSGMELRQAIRGDSVKGGAAMRAHACGLFPTAIEVKQRAIEQAEVTHASWVGRESSAAVALAVHYFARKVGPKANLIDWLNDERFKGKLFHDGPFTADGKNHKPWHPGSRVSSHGWDIVEAALFAVQSKDSLKAILKECVGWGGDTDTVAAVAMGIACWSDDIAQDLPKPLIDGLETGPYGIEFLAGLDTELRERFNL